MAAVAPLLAIVAMGAVAAFSGEAHAQAPSDMPVCPSAEAGIECVYHVRRTLDVGDTIPDIVRIDPDTGYVYVTSKPHLGSADSMYAHLRIYDRAEDGHGLIKDMRFNGTGSHIADIELDMLANKLQVAHQWGGGKANLTTIDLGTHEVSSTVSLMHGVVLRDGEAPANITLYRVRDLALDEFRNRAYVSTSNGPILAIDTSSGAARLLYTSTDPISNASGSWNAYDMGAPASALAVDNATGIVYTGVRTGNLSDPADHKWGVATLSFADAEDNFTPNYTRTSLLSVQSNPADGCSRGDYNLYPCSGDVLLEAIYLDSGRDKMFALYRNHTAWAYDLANSTGYPADPRQVDIRVDDPAPASYNELVHEDPDAPEQIHREIPDIALDAERGLLYASLYDFANPRVVVVNASDHARIGVASTSSQTVNLGLDASSGAMYVLPQWTPNAYVIEAVPRHELQDKIDNASYGDRIEIPNGTYRDVVLDITRPLTLTSESGRLGDVIFTGLSRIEVEADNVTITGLSFRNTTCLPGFAGSLIELRTYHDETLSNTVIEGNEFADTCHAAIQQEGTGTVSGVSIRNNTLTNIGTKIAPGRTGPIDTGGENEFQLFHGAIGLAFHPVQSEVSGAISNNNITNTSAAGIRVFNADGLEVINNTISNTPASAIGLAHGPGNAVIAGNVITGANSEPDLDYLDGIDGSGVLGYYRTIGPPLVPGGVPTLVDQVSPAPDAAINVWAGAMNVTVTGNTIRSSDGAFTVCTGVCAFESDGPVRDSSRNVPDNSAAMPPGSIVFASNTVYAHTGADNDGVLVRSFALGMLDVQNNNFTGLPDGAPVPVAGRVMAGDAAPIRPDADAAFVSRNTLRINYTAPLGPPPGYVGDIYGAITGPDGLDVRAVAVSEQLPSTSHTVTFSGAGVGALQTGTITLNTDLAGGIAANGSQYLFAAGQIPVAAAGRGAHTVPSGAAPVVIERDDFARHVNGTGEGEGARPAINVRALVDDNTAAFPPIEDIRLIASFAEVTFPPDVTAMSVPADGVIELYVSDSPPSREAVAAGFGIDNALAVVVGRVVEVGDNATQIVFDMPVRILLSGQAGGKAFYVNNADDAVMPIAVACAADDTAAVHAQLGGSGECEIDTGGDKVIHTYHLTRFGAAEIDEDMEPPPAPVETYPATALVNATARAAAGGTVAVPAGEYGEDVLIINKSLTIEPADPAGSPSVLTGYSHIVVRPAEADGPIVIRGIAFMNTTYTPDGAGRASIMIETRAGATPANATVQPVVIEGNTFGDTCDTAIRAEADQGAPPIAGLVIRNNTFYGIGSNTAGCEPAPGRADAVSAGGSYDGRFDAGAAQLRGLSILDNYIFGTTSTGIRVAGADGLVVAGNHIEGVPDDAIRILPSRDAVVRGNTIVGANGAPYMSGATGGAAGAAIEVWSGSDDVAVSLNRISGSAGAFRVCAGTCDPGAGSEPVQVAASDVGSADGANDIRFNHNVIAASNTGALIANDAGGMLNARANYYPGHALSAAVDSLYLASPSRAGGTVQVAPTLDGAGPVRIGAIVADGAGSPVRSAEAAVRAAFELGIRDFNAMQAGVGGFVGLEPVVHSVQSPDYTPSAQAEHAAALGALRTGADGDARMLPVLHYSISTAMAAYDGNQTSALAGISAMDATYGHYPFVTSRDGMIVAHGANASLVGDTQIVRALAGGTGAALADLYDFGSAEMGVAPSHPGAPWKWWTYNFADPSAAGENRSKRSVIALHPGPDGTLHNGDDLVFGAGYYP